MRILNRPMFRYGGPINEGVMHGMRNNYQSGQLVRPGPGRPGYQGPPKTKLGMAGWLATKLPWWSKIQTGTKDIIPKTIKKIRGSQPFEDMRGVFTQTGKGSGITSSPAATTFMQNLRSFPGASKIGGWATKAKDVALKYPKSTAAAALYGGVPLATNLPYKKIASTIADVAVPDQIYNWETGRWFNSDDTDLKPSDKKILEEKKTEIITSDKPDHLGTKAWIDPNKATRLAKDAQNKRLKGYLDMMGYDSAKKTAMSDALIDASALVQDASTEAGSLKHADWGKLINKAIQTTSRRLDKPEQIREAVGLMMTKGEIEKDIAAGKGGALRQNARDLVAAGVYKTEKEAMSHLGKVGSFEDTMAALASKTGKVTGDMIKVAWISDQKKPPRDHFKSTDEVYKDFKEKKEDAGDDFNVELKFVEENIDDRQPGDAFVVDDTLVIVNSDGSLDYKWK